MRDAHPDALLIGTEACEGYLPFAAGPSLGDWGRGETYGHDILQDLLAGANGWVDWNLILDGRGGPNWKGNFVDAAMLVDFDQGKWFIQPMFWYLTSFSMFLPPGSTSLAVSSSSSNPLEASMEAAAFAVRLVLAFCGMP